MARGISLDTLHTSVRVGRTGNKHATIPTHQDAVLAVAAADYASAAAAAADSARGAVKPTATDDADGLCSRACRDHRRQGLRDPLGPRRLASGHCLAGLHL